MQWCRQDVKEKKTFQSIQSTQKYQKNLKFPKVGSTEIERSEPRQRGQLVEDQDVFLFFFFVFLFWSVRAVRGWFLEVVGRGFVYW